MQTLDDVVHSVIQDFVSTNQLFTGLDVSNKVKEVLPFARHSEVSDMVRLAFASVIEPADYAKTPINVVLKDGSAKTAVLYHPISDSWELDAKYDNQKRAQTAARPTTPVAGVVAASLTADGTITVAPTSTVPVVIAPVVKPTADTLIKQSQARDLWEKLFDNQPSLFPVK